MSAPVTVGFVGTGIMGFHMARRLAESGHHVRAWNRTPDKAERLAPFGVHVGARAADIARDADVVICMLSAGPVCDDVLLGRGEVLASMRPASTLIVMSSIPVETARRQGEDAAARGVDYLDAPVSGGETGAQAGKLAIMAGGDVDVFERCRPLLEVMGRPIRVGPIGAGQLAKLVNQMMVASTIAAVAEALLFAERGGADPAQVREALLGGFADSTVLRQHGQRMIVGNFNPGGPAKYQVKDTSTALALSRSLGLELPVLGMVDGLFADMVSHGDGDLDHSAIIREFRRRNGLTVTDKGRSDGPST
ncbi:NAD(P)-dependent oxidoreductase [Piscinibacter sp.]|jgi:3-hydroxyisobutyrate dehydrogenase-like beta-hydroxyacid dehydrogenase|uniref:NAD(P)-dependent oxidoreductase n=1 Tax=Piscinibacter sp. TaxID=1903157 RepID=UPI003559D94A